MGLSEVISFAEENWSVIGQAFWAFFLCAVVCFAFGATVASKMNSSTNAAKNERLALAEERVNDYKEKLEGKSPDEAAKAIAALENRLASLEPWTLSEVQIAAMNSAIRGYQSDVFITRDISSPELEKVYVQTVSLFRQAGWLVSNGVVLDGGTFNETSVKQGTSPVGLILRQGADVKLTNIVRLALDAAKVDFSEVARPSEDGPPIQIAFEAIAI
jgi:hypothetical protein